VIEAGFAISGTWPMRTELSNRMIGSGTNALASSIVLVCRQRPANAPTATRRDFVTALKAELPAAIRLLQGLPPRQLPTTYPLSPKTYIAPVDLAQAAIGPGMAVYTRYAKVLDAEGKPLPVRAALALINQTLDEALAEQEGDFFLGKNDAAKERLMKRLLNLDEEILARFCEAHHIRRLSLFGSQLKGTARPDSDVDLLVEFDPEHIPTLFGIAGMEIELSRMLGKQVDLRTAGDLSRYFRDEVVRTAEVHYAA
jgi:predicted nucleotidyltransferase